MPRYSDDFRAKAVAALKVAGFPDKHGALVTVAEKLNVPVFTLRRWFRGEFNPPPETLVNDQLRDMRALLIDEMYTIMNALPEKRDGASYRQLALSLSTYFDKLPLLNDIPPKLMDIMPVVRELFQTLETLRWSPERFFEEMLEEAQLELEQKAFPEAVTTTNIESNDPIPNLA